MTVELKKISAGHYKVSENGFVTYLRWRKEWVLKINKETKGYFKTKEEAAAAV